MKTVCCVCHRVKTNEGWVLKGLKSAADVSHGYCPDCFHVTVEKFCLKGYHGNPCRSTVSCDAK